MTQTEDRIRALPLWNGGIDIAPLKGGLSNESFLVSDANGRHVVRFGIDFPFHHVFREREAMVARAAQAAGFGPEVRYAEQGVMVSAFLGAKTYDGGDVRENRVRIAQLIRAFHTEMPKHVTGAGFMFWVFHVIRDYVRTLEASHCRLTGELPGYLAVAEGLERTQKSMPIIFGHNDLLPANFLDDGDRLWLIDFEYAGFNTAMFDLAGTASNAGMTADEANELLEVYLQRQPSLEILRSHAAMQCASLLREVLWSLVSEIHLSAPGVDYEAYTTENLVRYQAALDRYHTNFGKHSS